jgi:opacity protein-like surface antigen
MKTTKLLVLALSLTFANAYAQTMGEERVLNSAPINVDGYLAEDKPVTDGELEGIRSELNKQKMGTQLNKEKAKDLGKLTNQTEKLLDSQDEYIDQKIESTNAIKEFNSKYEENQKKLRCVMEELNTEECEPYKKNYKRNKSVEVEEVQEVKVGQAAPVVSTAEVAPTVATGAAFEVIKLLPYAGATSYKGEEEELESKIAAGLRLESNITTRFSMGVGFNYASLTTNDFGNNSLYSPSQNYYNRFGQKGRDISYSSMGFDIYGKFFLTNAERFRPYIGAGLGYNRAQMKYDDNSNYNDPYNYYSYGSENFNTSFVTGQLMIGSEIMVTEGFGINIEAQYASGLGDSLSSKASKSFSNSPDQRRLRDLGNDIINANMLSIFAGAVVNF